MACFIYLIVYSEFHQKVSFRLVLKIFEHYSDLSNDWIFVTDPTIYNLFFWHYDKYKVSKNLGNPPLKAITIMGEEPSHLNTRLSIPQSHTTRCGTWAPHNTQVLITLFMDVVVQCRICHSPVFDLCKVPPNGKGPCCYCNILCCRMLLSLANLNIN
jgi:hypothetical protein